MSMLWCRFFFFFWLANCIDTSVAFPKSSGAHGTRFRGHTSIRSCSVCHTLFHSRSLRFRYCIATNGDFSLFGQYPHSQSVKCFPGVPLAMMSAWKFFHWSYFKIIGLVQLCCIRCRPCSIDVDLKKVFPWF